MVFSKCYKEEDVKDDSLNYDVCFAFSCLCCFSCYHCGSRIDIWRQITASDTSDKALKMDGLLEDIDTLTLKIEREFGIDDAMLIYLHQFVEEVGSGVMSAAYLDFCFSIASLIEQAAFRFLPVALITELRIVQHQLKFVGYNEAIVYFLIDCLKSKDSCKSLSCGKLELIKQWFEIVSNNKNVLHDEEADSELKLLLSAVRLE